MSGYVRPGNGAGDPSLWAPDYDYRHRSTRVSEGQLVGYRYAAWRIIEVRPVADHDLTDEQRDQIEAHVRIWKAEVREHKREEFRPTVYVLRHERGPLLAPKGWKVDRLHDGSRVIHVAKKEPGINAWSVLPEPYRVCSCHGDPWPCQEVDRAEVAAAAAERLDALMAKVPGCCWACGEPITSRQRTVAYPGDNIDLPGGPSVRFHQRRGCWGAALRYEERWIAVDPRHERILTYPRCGGMLIVHHDGSSECSTMRDRPAVAGEQACAGHLTHDHTSMAACYAADGAGCPRGCPREGHPGAAPAPRPSRQQSTLTN